MIIQREPRLSALHAPPLAREDTIFTSAPFKEPRDRVSADSFSERRRFASDLPLASLSLHARLHPRNVRPVSGTDTFLLSRTVFRSRVDVVPDFLPAAAAFNRRMRRNPRPSSTRGLLVRSTSRARARERERERARAEPRSRNIPSCGVGIAARIPRARGLLCLGILRQLDL